RGDRSVARSRRGPAAHRRDQHRRCSRPRCDAASRARAIRGPRHVDDVRVPTRRPRRHGPRAELRAALARRGCRLPGLPAGRRGAAGLIFVFRPRDPGAGGGVARGTVAGLFTVLALDLFSAAWLQRLYFVVESLVPAVLLHFALCFPEEKAVVRRHPWLKWGVYAACAPFAILQNWFLARDPERHLAVNDSVYVMAAV